MLVCRGLHVTLFEAICFTLDQTDTAKEHMQVSYLHLFAYS